MPELPEVETTVKGLQKKVLKKAFIDMWTDWEKMIRLGGQKRSGGDFKAVKKVLKGKQILRVWRRAKNIILELSDGYSLLVHMKMTGHLLVGEWSFMGGVWQAKNPGLLQDSINGFLHAVWFLDDGQMIALSDMRKFAKIELWKTEEFLASPEFLGWGPEPLEKEFTLVKFKKVLENKKGKIKQVIMMPNVLAGVGNIYASEALWQAKIHPEKSTAKLYEKELALLYAAIKKVLTLGIEFGGDSFSDYRDVNGEKGKFEGKKKAYQREGQPCYRCKTAIVRKVIGQRSAFFCPNCQQL